MLPCTNCRLAPGAALKVGPATGGKHMRNLTANLLSAVVALTISTTLFTAVLA